MSKEEQEKDIRVKLQKALDEEADKPLDEMNIERIEMLVKLLSTYDNDEYCTSDYDMFLEKFNSEKGIKLESSRSRRKKHSRVNNKYFTFNLSYRFVSVAVIIILVMTVSNIAVKASTDKSILSWLSQAKDSVKFELKNTIYEGWTKHEEESQTENPDYNGGDYCVDPDAFETMEVNNVALDFEDIDWSKTMKLNYVPKGFEVDDINAVEFGDHDGTLSVRYRNPGEGGYIYYFINQYSVDGEQGFSKTGLYSEYSCTIEYDYFMAYIFTGEKVNQAYFAADGKMYMINTTLDVDVLCKILENVGYSYDN